MHSIGAYVRKKYYRYGIITQFIEHSIMNSVEAVNVTKGIESQDLIDIPATALDRYLHAVRLLGESEHFITVINRVLTAQKLSTIAENPVRIAYLFLPTSASIKGYALFVQDTLSKNHVRFTGFIIDMHGGIQHIVQVDRENLQNIKGKSDMGLAMLLHEMNAFCFEGFHSTSRKGVEKREPLRIRNITLEKLVPLLRYMHLEPEKRNIAIRFVVVKNTLLGLIEKLLSRIRSIGASKKQE